MPVKKSKKAGTKKAVSFSKYTSFPAEYLKDFNGAQAVLRCNPKVSEESARRIASRLLTNVDVSNQVSVLAGKIMKKAETSVERIVYECACIAYADPRLLYDDNGKLKLPKDWPDNIAAAVSSMEVLQSGKADKVRLWSKTQALELLLRYKGLIRDSLDVNLNVSGRVVHEHQAIREVNQFLQELDAEAGHGRRSAH